MQATWVSAAWYDGSGVCFSRERSMFRAETSRGRAEPRIRKNKGRETLCILTLGETLLGSSVLNGKCAGGKEGR